MCFLSLHLPFTDYVLHRVFGCGGVDISRLSHRNEVETKRSLRDEWSDTLPLWPLHNCASLPCVPTLGSPTALARPWCGMAGTHATPGVALLQSISGGGGAVASPVYVLPPARREIHRARPCCAHERLEGDNARRVLLADVLSESKVLLIGEIAAPLHAENAQPSRKL